jgi:LPXTG-motif cell wall-anchored protein
MLQKRRLQRLAMVTCLVSAFVIFAFATGTGMAIQAAPGDQNQEIPTEEIPIPDAPLDGAQAQYDEPEPTPPADTQTDTATPTETAPATTTLPATGIMLLGYSAVAASLMGAGFMINRRKK